jgi:hypothetical protein
MSRFLVIGDLEPISITNDLELIIKHILTSFCSKGGCRPIFTHKQNGHESPLVHKLNEIHVA